MSCFIYLIESSLGQYIGSSVNPKKRLQTHIRESKKHNGKCASKIVLQDLNFQTYIIDKIPETQRIERERFWINIMPRTVNFQFKNKPIDFKARIHKKGRICNRFKSRKINQLRSYTRFLKSKNLFR